jgi:crossover junction endodeoxyribonuclease RuvC
VRVIGLDPGSRITGFGVIELDGGTFRHIESGNLRLPDSELPERLRIIFQELNEIIERTRPRVMAVERVFMARNAQSALTLGQARGAALVAAANRGVEVVEYSALQVKRATVGQGRAAKQQVQHMVRVLLALPVMPAADAADALACAICHCHTSQGASRLRSGLAVETPT